jgi:hypothetical protein
VIRVYYKNRAVNVICENAFVDLISRERRPGRASRKSDNQRTLLIVRVGEPPVSKESRKRRKGP